MILKFQKLFRLGCVILRAQRVDGTSVEPDEAAHYVSPHLVLHCLQI